MYVLGGITSALIDVGTMQLLINFGISYIPATTSGYFIGLLVNIVFHSKVTFPTQLTSRVIFRFGILVAINYINTLLLTHLSFVIADKPIIGKLLSLPVVTLTGFILGKYWIFTDDRRKVR